MYVVCICISAQQNHNLYEEYPTSMIISDERYIWQLHRRDTVHLLHY